jgi:hypothetical protein
MGISLETLALAKKYTDAVSVAGSEAAMQKAIETAVKESKLYTDTVVSNLIQFQVTIVNSLPITNIDTHTIYFVPMSTSEKDDKYFEYMYIDGKWELIGNTQIDLSDYYTKKEVEQYILDNKYVLPIASNSTLGGVKIDNSSILIDTVGTISVSKDYTETTAQNVINKNFISIKDDEILKLF